MGMRLAEAIEGLSHLIWRIGGEGGNLTSMQGVDGIRPHISSLGIGAAPKFRHFHCVAFHVVHGLFPREHAFSRCGTAWYGQIQYHPDREPCTTQDCPTPERPLI